jgi:outer membrane protein assembly factor BamD
MFRRVIIAVLIGSVLLIAGCTNKKVKNPIANVDSKQPDKVLFDRAMDAMKHNKYDVARLSLQTLINTYPDSEYVARAKLAVGDSWYAEGGSAAWTQAEAEYKDFQTFFPNMPEAAEAQMKIANIHFKEMEKPDRDYTHAKRAEDEYRQVILQYPDSPLVPEAKERLLQVQEVLAEREYGIGHFYYLRENWPAAIARLRSTVDTYPLYSDADQALLELGECYQREVDVLRASKLTEQQKGGLIKQYNKDAAEAYARIITRYPEAPRASEAKKRLEAMKMPVPTPTPEAIAQNKKEIASRTQLSMYGRVMENFRKSPDMTQASKVGEPTLVDPKQASAPEFVRTATSALTAGLPGATNGGAAATVGNGATPAAAGAAGGGEHSAGVEILPGPTGGVPSALPSTGPGANAGGPVSGAPASGATNTEPASDLGNDLAPAPTAPAAGGTAAAGSTTSAPDTGSQVSSGSATNTATTSSPSSNQTQAPPANSATESTSKQKKKHLWPF